MTTPSAPPPRRTAARAAGMALVVALAAVPVVLFLRGDSTPPASTTTTSTTAPTTTESPTTTVMATTTAAPTTTTPVTPVAGEATLYFLADYVEQTFAPGPFLVPVRRAVEVAAADGARSAADEIGAALDALLAGPSAADDGLVPGISSAIPEGTELLGVAVDPSGTRVTLDFNRVFESGGGTFSMGARLAQVVYTATRSGPSEVTFAIEGAPVEVFSSEGILLDGPQRRDGYRDLLPPIFPERPLPGDLAGSPLEIEGVSNTFEATLQYRIEAGDGAVLAEGFTTATCGTGCWGDFSIRTGYMLDVAGPGTVVLFEASAQDGRPVNVVRIPVELEAASDPEVRLDVFAELPGGMALRDDPIVVTSPLRVSGSTNSAAAVAVNGTPVAAAGGFFETDVVLIEGRNRIEVAVGAARFGYDVFYVPDGEVQFGFVASVTPTGMSADYAQFLSGDEANQAAIEDGEIAPGDTVPNDYYIRNQNSQLRALPLAADVHVVLATAAAGPVETVPVTLAEWLGLFTEDGTPWNYDVDDVPEWEGPHYGYFGAGTIHAPYWFTLDADGVVIQVVQQYLP